MNFKKFSVLVIMLLFVHGNSEEEIYSLQIDSCTVTLEAEKKWQNLHVRVVHKNGKRCSVSEDDLYAFLDSALIVLAAKTDTVNYKSIFLGRIIVYPWISKFLADTASKDPKWQNDKGKPEKGHENTYVGAILFNDKIVSSFNNRLAKIGYRVSGISVEKVLISRGKREHLPDWVDLKYRLPYDAMIWLSLEKL